MGSSYIATGDPIIMEGKICTPSTDMGFVSPNNVVNKMGVFNDLLINGQECSISVYSKLLLSGKTQKSINIFPEAP